MESAATPVVPARSRTLTSVSASAGKRSGGVRMANDPPELTVVDADAWRAWLEEHHEQTDGVWLVLAKKGTTEPTRLRYGDAVEEALCFGWVDGQARRLDDAVYHQRFTPRRARSKWSKRNVELITRLESEG